MFGKFLSSVKKLVKSHSPFKSFIKKANKFYQSHKTGFHKAASVIKSIYNSPITKAVLNVIPGGQTLKGVFNKVEDTVAKLKSFKKMADHASAPQQQQHKEQQAAMEDELELD